MAARRTSGRRPPAKTKTLPRTEARRSPCAISSGLEILGDRWTLLIVRDLMFTNRCEFGHFLHAMEGISTNILTERLERLQCSGIIEKLPHPEHGKKFIYRLTERGIALAPMLIELSLWGYAHVAGTFIPPAIYTMMMNDRSALLKKIAAREPLVTLEL